MFVSELITEERCASRYEWESNLGGQVCQPLPHAPPQTITNHHLRMATVDNF